LRVLLLPPRLVGGRHRLLEALEDRLERDPLLPLELAQRRDHLLVHDLLPAFFHSKTVLAEAMPSWGTRSSPPSDAMTIASASAETSAPTWTLRPSTGSTVFTLTCCPTLRSKCRGSRSARSSPGELTSRSYGRSCSNPSRSSRRDRRCDVAAIVSRSTPPSFLPPPARSTVTRRIRRPPSRPKETSHNSSPAASTTGRTRSPTPFSRTPNDPFERKSGREPTSGDAACVSAAQYTRRCRLGGREAFLRGPGAARPGCSSGRARPSDGRGAGRPSLDAAGSRARGTRPRPAPRSRTR